MPIDFKDDTVSHSDNHPSSNLTTCRIVPNSTNSTCMVEYSFMIGTDNEVQLIAGLQGPTEAKFASKQDPVRTTIEVIIKCPNSQPSEYRSNLLV